MNDFSHAFLHKTIRFVAAMLIVCGLGIVPSFAQQAVLHYFDNEYRLGNSINEAFENLKGSGSKIALKSATESLSFTDGAIFVLGNANNLDAASLKNAKFTRTAQVKAIYDGVNYIFLNDEMSGQAADSEKHSAMEELATFLEAEIGNAELMQGQISDGTRIQALRIPNEKDHEFWENTMQLEHTLNIDGKDVNFRTVIKPQGLMTPRMSAVNAAKNNSNHALISIGAGAALMSEGNPSSFGNMYRYFDEAGTELLLLNPEDLFGLWNAFENGGMPKDPVKPIMVFTNADFSDTKLNGEVLPYYALNINGRKILFFSVGGQDEALETKLDGSGIRFWNPSGSRKLSKLIRDARKSEKADAVILSNSYSETESSWMEELKGVDLVINRKRWGKAASQEIKADLEARTDRHDTALELNRDRHGDGKIELFFNEKALSGIHLSEEDGNYDIFKPEAREEQKTAILKAFISDENAIMPDAAEMDYTHERTAFQSPTDFAQAAAGLIRRHFGTEFAAVEIKANPSHGITGYLATDEGRDWLGSNEPVKAYLVPGKALKAIKDGKAGSMTFEQYAAAKSSGKTLYAVSGLDKRGKLSGLAIRDDEMYTAALPESLAKKCSGAKDMGKEPVRLSTFIIGEMKKIRKENPERENWKTAVASAAADRTETRGVWRLELANLYVFAERTNVHSPKGYAGTSESAFGTENRTKISASGLVKVPYVKGDFFFTPSVSGSYGKTKYETYTGLDSDKLDYNAEFLYAPFETKAFGGTALHGPFLTAEYETEFEAENYDHRKKIYRGKTGWKMFDGKILKEAYAAADIERKEYPGDPYTHYLVEAFAKGEYDIPHTNLKFEASALYRRYMPCHDDNSTNLRQRLEVNAVLSTEIYKNLGMGFYTQWIYATGAKLGGYADSFTFGGTLSYKFLTKWN